MDKKEMERRIHKLEATLESLLAKLKLEAFVDEDHVGDEVWMSATIVKKRKYPWE